MEFNNNELEAIKSWFECIRELDKVEMESADFRVAKKIYDHLGYAIPTQVDKRSINGR